VSPAGRLLLHRLFLQRHSNSLFLSLIQTQQFSIQSERACEVGELLKLGLPESVILKAAALVYLTPLFGLFAGALLGQFFASLLVINSDLCAIAFAALGALAAWFFGKRKAKQLEVDSQPVILAYLGTGISLDKLSF